MRWVLERLTRPPLTMRREAMRKLGYSVIDALVDHFEDKSCPPEPLGEPNLDWLDEPLCEDASNVEAVVKLVTTRIMPFTMAMDHPRCFAMVPSPSNFVSVMADALSAGFNVHAGTGWASPAASEIERIALDWLRSLLNLPEGMSGVFTSGGAAASLIGLALARHRILGESSQGVLYVTEYTHPVNTRSARILGLADVRRIAAHNRRMDVAALAHAVEVDRARGLSPFCVVATAGTTDTGAVDDLVGIAEVCQKHGLWLHVDGSYGAAAACTARGRELLRGLGLADSIAIDPHKWLFQPYELGALLTRHPAALEDAFRLDANYFSAKRQGRIDFKDRGVELTRSFKALKLWMSLKVFGAAEFRRAVDHGLDLAEVAAKEIRRHGGRVVSNDGLAIVTFRFEPQGAENLDGLQARLARALALRGDALVNTTEVDGLTVLRMCTIHPRTTPDDVRRTIAALAGLAQATRRVA